MKLQNGIMIHAIGIYICFLSHGVFQEKISTTQYEGTKFQNLFFISFFQSLIGMFCSYFVSKAFKHSLKIEEPNPLPEYLKISILHLITGQLSYKSLQYINYPTLIIGKSCKLIPIVLMNFLLYKKKFGMKKYLSILMTTVGVLSFMLFENKTIDTRKNSLFGLILLIFGLLIDGTINSLQDNLFSSYKVSSYHMMFFANFLTMLSSLFIMCLPTNNQFKESLIFIKYHPTFLKDVILFCLCQVIGQIFIYSMIEQYGTVTLASINVSRKIFSILISLFWFKHTISLMQWISIVTLFTSFGIDMLEKSHNKKVR